MTYIEWRNSLSAVYLSYGWEGGLVKMGAFYKHSLLVERIGLDPTRE